MRRQRQAGLWPMVGQLPSLIPKLTGRFASYSLQATKTGWPIKDSQEPSIGVLLKRASTGNVLFRTAILEKYEPPLNFDINMTMTGGSDTDFFMRLVQHGGKIVYVGDAEVSEAVVPVRLTIRWRLRRQYQSSANRVYIESKLFGTKHVMATSLKQVFRHVLEGTLRLVFSPLLLLAGYTKFKRGWYHGLRHYAKAAGTLAGLRGSHVQLYLKTDGH